VSSLILRLFPAHAALPNFTVLRIQTDFNNHLIRAINMSSRAVTTVSGRLYTVSPYADGLGAYATFNHPTGIALDAAGTVALVVRTCVTRVSSLAGI
jgi:hypothetical protein